MLWSHRACQGAKKKEKGKRQHLSHCWSYVFFVCFLFRGESVVVADRMWILKTALLSTRPEKKKKELPALCLDAVPFCVFVVVFVCRPVQVVRRFDAFQPFDVHSWWWRRRRRRMLWHPRLCRPDFLLSFFFFLTTASVFFFDILLLYFCYCCWKKEKWQTTTYGLVFCRCGIDHTVLASGWPAGLKPFWQLPGVADRSTSSFRHPSSTRCKAPKLFCHLLNLAVVTRIFFVCLFFLL